MNRMARMWKTSGAALVLVGCLNGPLQADAPVAPPATPTQNVAPTQEWPNTAGALPAGEFAVRYLVFTTKPKTTAPAAVKDPKYWAPYFEDTYHGSATVLGPAPEAYLGILRKMEPHLDFKMVFAGHAVSKQGAAIIDSGPSRRNDSFQIQLADQITLTLPTDDKKIVEAKMKGNISDQREGGRASTSWDGVKDVQVRKTYNMGSRSLPGGETLVYVFCILR